MTEPLWPKPIPVIGGTGEYESGKAQPLDAKILTPSGWIRMGDVQIGQHLINPDGGTSKVIGVYPQGKKPVYQVKFSDGATTECCDDHLWLVKDPNNISRGTVGSVISLREIRNHKRPRNFRVPLPLKVQFDQSEETELDPYVMGVIIGDGCLRQTTPTITNPEKEILETITSLLPTGVSLRQSGDTITYRISGAMLGGSQENPVTGYLRRVGLYGRKSEEKQIPEEYLRGSEWNRVKLLQGLCDTDGSASPGSCEYSTSSTILATQVQELARSLGGTAKICSRIPKYQYLGEKKEGQLSFRVTIRLPEGINPFSLTRKAETYATKTITDPARLIRSIELVGSKECQCIALDSENKLYITDDYIVTHNTLFGLTIAPGPDTYYYDFEQSGASYNELGHKRVNVLKEMQEKYPNGYKSVDLFLWWLNDVRSIPANKYRVIVIDPATDIERGLTDWVAANPQHFGHTSAQYQKMQGIMWGDVKDYWKSILADLSVRCETLYFTAHLGKEFEGNTPTGKLKAKGKNTLTELASLYLWFSRKADVRGVRPNAPSAKVIKARTMIMKVMPDGEIDIQQVLPPTLPVATPKAIREAFAKPAGGREIDEIERHHEDTLSDEERMRLETARFEAERDAHLARTGQLNPQTEAAKIPPPTDEEITTWISEAKTIEEVKAVGAKIGASNATTIQRAKFKPVFAARMAEIEKQQQS